jgi:tetratricopeptide (TPR) repeat protein
MEPLPINALEVFYSYSHKDEELRNQMATNLAMLKREGVIKEWHDRRISAGQEWDGEIDAHLKSANIILLLVSPEFLASDYCYDIEVRQAMERHEAGEARVIPIILRPCDWAGAPFSKVQALPKDAKPVTRWEDRDEAFLDITKGIRKAAEEINSKHRAGSLPAEAVKPVPHLHIPDTLRVAFVARQDREGNDVVERLKGELAPHKNRLVALWGAGGVGKTAIAAEVARSLRDAFNQRVVWVSADGREDFNLSFLLDGIATQLGQDDLRKLTLEQKKEKLRDVLMSAPTLIVLDNFETIVPEEGNRCAEWLAQPALCSVLITTRQKIEAAHRNIPIGSMLAREALDLLQRLIAQVHDPKAFENLDRERVIQIAEANPLVLQWIVGQIDLAQDAEEVLNDLKHGEGTAAERVFDRSFNLPQLNNGGRAVLLALSLFVPSATRKALAEVAGLSKEKDKKRFKEAVKTLSSLWLLRTAEAGERLAVEGLTRELTRARLSSEPRSKLLPPRYVARFLRHAQTYSENTVEHLDRIEAEKDNILNAMDVASELSDWNSLIRIRNAIEGFLNLRGYWDEALRKGEQALNVARNLEAEPWIALFTHNVAMIHQNRGSLAEARRLYDESLEIARKLGDQKGIASTLHQLALLSQSQGDLAEARRLYDESLEIEKKLGDQSGIAKTLHQLATLAQQLGDLAEARRLYDESLEIEKKLGDQKGIAGSLLSLAWLSQEQGDLAEARRLYDESLEIARKLGDQKGIAGSLLNLALLSQSQGDLAEARRLYDESLEIEKKLGDQSGIASTLHHSALLFQEQGDLAEARRLYDESLEIARKLGDQRSIAGTLHQLGMLSFAEEDYQEAERLLAESLTILRKLEDKNNISECLESIGKLNVVQNSFAQANRLYNEALQIAQTLGAKFRIASVKRSLGLLEEKEKNWTQAAQLIREALSLFEELGSPHAEAARQDLLRLERESS